MEQPGAEIMVPLTRFWERQGRVLLGVLAGVAVLALIGVFALRSRAASEEAAAGKLAEASIYYWQGDFPRALQMARETSQQYGSTPSGVDAHRIAGDASFFTGDYKTAIAEYRRFLDRNRKGLLADAVRRSLAYAFESDNQFGEAKREYLGLIGRFDRSSSAEFLMAAARCDLAQNQPGAAIEQLKRLTDEFGDAEIAQLGRVQLAELQARNPAAATP